jgi:hypothetical protein
MLQFVLPTEIISDIDILKFVKFADCYPNVSIAYRVLLIVSVTIASKKFFKIELD